MILILLKVHQKEILYNPEKKMIEKKISYKIKNRIIKSKKQFDKNIKNFFDWIKGAEIIELTIVR